MKLDKIKHTNFKYSLYWKLLSYKLLTKAKDKREFAEAVLWCGNAGNVIRTVETDYQKDFCSFVFEKKNEILEGSFNIFDCLKFGDRPLSYISKICHILNPRKYPLIYDSNIKNKFDIKNEKDFQKIIEEHKKKVRFWSRKRIYELDSKMWAE